MPSASDVRSMLHAKAAPLIALIANYAVVYTCTIERRKAAVSVGGGGETNVRGKNNCNRSHDATRPVT